MAPKRVLKDITNGLGQKLNKEKKITHIGLKNEADLGVIDEMANDQSPKTMAE